MTVEGKHSAAFDPAACAALVGPTGSGKTNLALTLCREFPMEVVCMDSMQIYRELDIGTAAPSPQEMAAAPHHLFRFQPVTEAMTCVQYARIASEKAAEILVRGKIPLFVGGTGLYMKALFEGTAPLPQTPPDLRERLDQRKQKRGLQSLYNLLQRLDPAGAARLHANDSQRIQRFLEVRLLTGRGMLELWQEQEAHVAGRAPLTVGLEVPRPYLWEKIALRTEKMLSEGWVEETRQLLEKGLGDYVFTVGPIGYRLVAEYLSDKMTLKDVSERIAVLTRQYAKRQMTWFRKVPYIKWFPFDPDSGYNVASIIALYKDRFG